MGDGDIGTETIRIDKVKGIHVEEVTFNNTKAAIMCFGSFTGYFIG